MNIFITSNCPIKCAQHLDNKRVVKMVLESTQMLCTAINEIAGKRITPYKSTHINHPCNKWIRKSPDNWNWLYRHAIALSDEYTRRYNKIHKCLSVLKELDQYHIYENTIGLTPFPNCARNKSLNIDYTDIKDTCVAYQLYLSDRWDTDKLEPKWN